MEVLAVGGLAADQGMAAGLARVGDVEIVLELLLDDGALVLVVALVAVDGFGSLHGGSDEDTPLVFIVLKKVAV
jgi:hypothetical protein